MRNQLKIIKEQIESIQLEVHTGGLGTVPCGFYQIIDCSISNLSNEITRLMYILEDAEKSDTRHHKKMQKSRGKKRQTKP